MPKQNAIFYLYSMRKFFLLCIIALFSCGGDWEGGSVGRASCTVDNFDFRPAKIAASNNGNYLYILDAFNYVHSYKRDNLYVCAFKREEYYGFSGFPNDVVATGNDFYVQDKAQLKSRDNKEVCNARDGVFVINGNELAVGSNIGIEVWDINTCIKKPNIFSQKVWALAAANGQYFFVTGISAPATLNINFYSDPMSSTPGNEKHFCSATRLAANNHGVYLLDKECKKIGVYDNQGVWRKTLSLDSIGIRNVLDIAPAEYSYILILHSNGVEKINVF